MDFSHLGQRAKVLNCFLSLPEGWEGGGPNKIVLSDLLMMSKVVQDVGTIGTTGSLVGD